MKASSHLVGLYYRSLRRYKRIASRLKKESNREGYRYQTLLNKLVKLGRKIANLQIQLKLAAATGAVVLGGFFTGVSAQTHNGPFVPQSRLANPLREPLMFDGTTFPATVDLDKDGDFDLVVGDDGNYNLNDYSFRDPLRYLVNVGTSSNPSFEEKFGNDNPFAEIDIQYRDRAPLFADIDNDGDADLFVGISYSFYNYSSSLILYYKNENGAFVQQEGAWNAATKTGNPFDGIALAGGARLAFLDFDKDQDLDAFIAGVVTDEDTGEVRYVSYFKNDGQGNFSDASGDITFSPTPTNDDLNPAFADLDNDGDMDLIFGGYYTIPRYYKQVSPNNFVEQTGPFNAQAQSGNPFDAYYDTNNQPVFVDLDNDSDLDMLVGDGDGDHYFRYPSNIIHYFENKGNGLFEEKRDLENPLGGVYVKEDASPVLVDLDGDGDLDALIGHKYNDYFVDYNTPVHYMFQGGKFVRQKDEDSPFGNVKVSGTITPSVADLDADGDLDFITGNLFGGVSLFRNNSGTYSEVLTGSPFDGIDLSNKTSPELADTDGDGDFDLLIASRYGSHFEYYENTGTPQVPVFEERIDGENPFLNVGNTNDFRGYMNLADVDHDGDLDIIASESFYFKYNHFSLITYYENTGTRTNPVYALSDDQPFVPENPFFAVGIWELQPYLADQDQDGDLDLFTGNYFGHIQYTRNENPAVVSSVNTTPLTFRVAVDEEVLVDPTITLSDADDDLVVQATVTITNFQAGDELHFVSQGGITGSFSNSSGVLTLRGKSTRSTYEALLRTVTYHHHAASDGRTSPRKKSTIEKAIAIRVYDTDFTNPQPGTRTLNVLFNDPPVIESRTESTAIGQSVTIGLAQLLSDPDNNLDLSTLRIVQQPSSGAAAHISADNDLVIDYDGLNFTGVDHLTIEVCDDLGECAQNIITIEVNSGELVVYNAVAPNSIGDNKHMRIRYLPEKNKVTIFSRWGDKVFEMRDYDSEVAGKRFEGLNSDGKRLPTGIYFYKVEIQKTATYNGPEVVTGYISLKQ